MRSLLFSASVITAITLSACAQKPDVPLEQGQYWQRISTTEAIYLQGPKAQESLNRDIAQCVVELRELERLGQIKNSVSMDENGRIVDPDRALLENNDMPERSGDLLLEQTNYRDFEGCMLAKGWERVAYVPYNVVKDSQESYLRNHVDYSEYFITDENVKRKEQRDYEANYND